MFNPSAKYHVLVSEKVSFSYATPVACAFEHRPNPLEGELSREVKKGVYSFFSTTARQQFIEACNSQGFKVASKLPVS